MVKVVRSHFRQALEKALKNRTMAGSRIWHERRVAFGLEEMPAINIIYANPENTPDRDDRWQYHRFTVAGVLLQENYRSDDGGLAFAMQADEFDAEIKQVLNCLRVPGCVQARIERSYMEFSAEGKAMLASAWTTMMFQTEVPMFGETY